MAALRIVLVEPKYEGNVGSVARAMRNFGFADLALVNPPELGEEARRFAMHGIGVLEGARTVRSLKAAVRGCDLVAGTTAIATRSERKFARIPVTPRDLADRTREFSGRLALVLGREDYGLFDEEIRLCDLLVTIPTDPRYPVMNVSHAAAVLLYELGQLPTKRPRKAADLERERLHTAFADLLAASRYPAFKRARTQVMFRRLVGRAMPTKWEFHALMGVFTRASKTVRRLEKGVR